jgi:sugar-phosphatase
VSFAAVISDLDGVLVDSRAATLRAWEVWAGPNGLDGAAIHDANHGRPSREVLAELVAPERVDAEAARLLEIEVTDTRGVVAFGGAAGVLALPTVAICTSCTMPLAQARLRATGLRPPEVLVTADQVERGKPAPDPYLLAAARLSVDPRDCLVLEDAPSGIESGRAAGMTVWAVTTTHARSELGGAERVADALDELLAALVSQAAA